MRRDLSDYNTEELSHAIDLWIHGRNSERNRQIFKRSMFDGVSYERIAEEYGLTPRQIANIIYKCQDQLFRHI